MIPTYSVIVPAYNEEGNVQGLFESIKKTMDNLGDAYEVIFVNDGSSDQTLEVLKKFSPIKIINFRKNFGQTAALDAGFKAARGEYFITLDGDGQNPPEEIPKLIHKMKEGDFDVVSGWRRKRKDPFFKRFASKGAYILRNMIVKDHVKDSGCSLKIYKRECFDGVDLFGEMHRFIPAVLHWRGFTIGEVEVSHQPRVHGVTKYNWKRTFKGFVDMISVWFWRKYSNRPLHLFGGAGMMMTTLGLLGFVVLAVLRIFFDYGLSDKIWPLVFILMVIMGVQLFISGLMADIAVKNYYSGKRRPYIIKEVIEI
ncbi:glycosyltransferase family 2 protein [Patescibacteria group bacterium]|nr:glycosyltransferase family 2 protein [Patescibacteria group bacterium]